MSPNRANTIIHPNYDRLILFIQVFNTFSQTLGYISQFAEAKFTTFYHEKNTKMKWFLIGLWLNLKYYLLGTKACWVGEKKRL